MAGALCAPQGSVVRSAHECVFNLLLLLGCEQELGEPGEARRASTTSGRGRCSAAAHHGCGGTWSRAGRRPGGDSRRGCEKPTRGSLMLHCVWPVRAVLVVVPRNGGGGSWTSAPRPAPSPTKQTRPGPCGGPMTTRGRRGRSAPRPPPPMGA